MSARAEAGSGSFAQEVMRVAQLGHAALTARAAADKAAIRAEAEQATAHEIARELRAGGMGCNCDLDNWEPERLTGHSWVCHIHKATVAKLSARRPS